MSASFKGDSLAVNASRPAMGLSSKPGSTAASRSMLAKMADPGFQVASSRNNSLPKLASASSQHLLASESATSAQNNQGAPLGNQQPPLLQLHMAASNTISLPFSGNMTSFPPAEATHAIIQSTWGLFAAMGDAQRNQLLKGLLTKCSTKQVDLICTCLNLKMAEPTLPGHGPTVFATDAVGKFSPQNRIMTGRKSSTRSPHRPQHQTKSADPHSIGAIQTNANINNPNSPFKEIYISPTPTHNKDPRHPTTLLSTTTTASQQQQSQNSFTTPNLYIKLLNTNYNPQTLLKQVQNTNNIETARTLFEFVLTRTEKQQSLLTCMQALSNEPAHGTVESLQSISPGQRLLNCALEICGARDGTLYKVDQATGELSVVASTWATREGVLDFQVGPGLGERILGAEHLLKGELVNVFNVKESEIYTDPAHDYYGVRGKCEVECVLSLPVTIGGVKLVGAIEVMNKVGWNAPDRGSGTGGNNNPANGGGTKDRVSPFFNAEDEYMLKCLGSIWTILLSSGGVGGAGSMGGSPGTPGKKKDDIKMLMNTASFMSSDLDLNGLVRVVMQTAQELLSAERCAVFMVDHKKKELWSSVAEGAGEIRIPMNKGIAGYVATSGEVLNIPNAYQDPRFNRAIDIKTGFYTRNILCIPMKSSKGQIIGVAQLINKMPEPMIFTNEDEMLLTAFSSLASTTIEKNLVFQELQSILDDTSEAKVHLSKIVQGLPSVIIALDNTGRVVSVNHPELLNISDETMDLMKFNSFDIWLGSKTNALLIDDIRSAFKGEIGICGRDYELVLNGHVFVVNYTASEMEEPEIEEDEDEEGEDEDGEEGDGEGGEELNRAAATGGNGNRGGKSIGFKFDLKDDEGDEESSDEENSDDGGGGEQFDDYMRKKVASFNKGKKVEGVVLCLEIIDSKRRITDTLLKYMPPPVVQNLLAEAIDHSEGCKLRASALSVDLRGFASLCDRLDAKDSIFILNQYHQAAYDVLSSGGGLVDKISSEKVSAAFGVPDANESDPFDAINAAMRLLSQMEKVNSRLSDCSLPMVHIGLGIATGNVLCGIVGPSKRLDHVIMGETVTNAASIQEATKLYGCNLLICDKTQREVRDKFHFREIDNVKVKGNNIPITLYEVLGPGNAELAREIITSTICFELGLSEYRNQNYSVAQLHFKKAIQTSDDGPSKMFVQRCQDLLEGKIKLAAEWDGCWDLDKTDKTE